MILYNISIIIEDSSHDELLTWITKLLEETTQETRFLKMLENPHEGTTYCIHTTINDELEITKFQKEITHAIQDYIGTHHNGKAFIFDSKMEYLQ
ncbi:DUF4286 family protein [Sphingobacterium shayense]|uniref:DUF4286 family protein n=1 Tax=Sphingobacterium shayense TaxID=626343 RepID=UPI001FED151C|nr:DUF4286 family protein [Sphingobacterium shayense]